MRIQEEEEDQPIFTVEYHSKQFHGDTSENTDDALYLYNNNNTLENVFLPEETKISKYILTNNSDSEDSIDSEAPTDDLEKSSASCAASTVVFLIILYMLELLFMCVFLISSDRHNQGQMIAQKLCRGFPAWEFMENLTTSWCDPRIFDRDFRLELQCPCFVPDMFRNMTVY